jgi:hypothetical protein
VIKFEACALMDGPNIIYHCFRRRITPARVTYQEHSLYFYSCFHEERPQADHRNPSHSPIVNDRFCRWGDARHSLTHQTSSAFARSQARSATASHCKMRGQTIGLACWLDLVLFMVYWCRECWDWDRNLRIGHDWCNCVVEASVSFFPCLCICPLFI